MPGKKTRLLHQLWKYSSFIGNTWVISPTAVGYSKTERKICRSFPQIYRLQPGLCIFRACRPYQCSKQEDPLASPVIQHRVTSHPHPGSGGEVEIVLGELGGDSGHRTEQFATERDQSTLKLIYQDASLLHESGHDRQCKKGCSWLAGVGRHAGCYHVLVCTGIPFF